MIQRREQMALITEDLKTGIPCHGCYAFWFQPGSEYFMSCAATKRIFTAKDTAAEIEAWCPKAKKETA